MWNYVYFGLHYKEFWAKSVQRLLAILDSKPIRPSLPLVIILVGGSESLSAQVVQQNLDIRRLQEEKLLSSVYTTRMPSSPLWGVDVLSPTASSKACRSTVSEVCQKIDLICGIQGVFNFKVVDWFISHFYLWSCFFVTLCGSG